MRLVDADATIKFLTGFGNREYRSEKGTIREAIKALKYAEYTPTIDAEPVRHARWADNHCTACGMMPMGDEMWKHCDFEPPRFEWFMDYCPNCGAKMDEEG